MNKPIIELSIVMPCLNEAATVGQCVRKAKAYLERSRIIGEVIVSDNGSCDGSGEIAARAGAVVTTVTQTGYGAAICGGIRQARGKYIIIGDADDSYDFSSLDDMVTQLRQGYDLVMGCRLSSGGGSIEPGAMPPLNRYVGNPVLSTIGKLFFKVPVNDFHCGLRGMTRAAFFKMKPIATGMEFASEIIIKAKLLDLKITEVPITLHCTNRSRQPHLRPWRDGWRHLKLLFLYNPRWLFLYPGIVFFGSGLTGMMLLAFMGKIQIGHVILFINAMLVFSLVFMTGAQLIFFSVIANRLAVSSGLALKDPVAARFGRITSMRSVSNLGLLTFLTGTGILGYHIWTWAHMGFAISLNDYPMTIKAMILAVTLTIFGIQLLFFSFVVDMIDLVNTRRSNSNPTKHS